MADNDTTTMDQATGLARRLREAELLNEANAIALESALRTRNGLLRVMREHGLAIGADACEWLHERLEAEEQTEARLKSTLDELGELTARMAQHGLPPATGSGERIAWVAERLAELVSLREAVESARRENDALRQEAGRSCREAEDLRRASALAQQQVGLQREVDRLGGENEKQRREITRLREENGLLRHEAERGRQEIARLGREAAQAFERVGVGQAASALAPEARSEAQPSP